MRAPLRLTLAQLNPTVGDIEGNCSKILEIWDAHDSTTDLVIFPELFLTGYQPEDLVHNAPFQIDIEKKIEDICAASKNFQSAAIIPTPKIIDQYVYNTFLFVQDGEIRHIQKKVKLPNYGVFDEMRIFGAGELPQPIPFKDYKIGFMICEDMWYEEIPRHLAAQSADILISINGSPYDYNKKSDRLAIAEQAAKLTGLSVIYLNMVGGQDELVYDGTSFIVHANGQLAYQAPTCIEVIIKVDVDMPGTDKSAHVFNIVRGTDTRLLGTNYIADNYKAMTLGLRDYVRKNGFSKVILGLSGGIDSALVAAMAVEALGAYNVRAVMLPSEFTSQESLKDAEECAQNLKIEYDVLPIKDAVKTFEAIIPDLKGLAHENTQSRIRGLILMALSNMSGAMLLSTGNKSELATGYATLYGDMNGGYNPLKDAYKTEVYKLATYRNSEHPVIPQNILTKAPSAELRPNQKDQDSLPPYDLLDDILLLLVEMETFDWRHATPELLALREKCLQHPQEVEKVAKLLKISEFKRFQACPGPRISPRTFGKDRRYPITNKFLNRIEKA